MMLWCWKQRKVMYILIGNVLGVSFIFLYQGINILIIDSFQENIRSESIKRRSLLNETSYTIQKRPPDALVIGVMKCGTDALRAFLSLHPDIAMSPYEPNYWCETFHRGFEHYLNKMAESKPGQISMEKSTCFTHRRPYSPRRVFFYDRNIKMIVVVREPIQRALSQFTLDKHKNRTPDNLTFDRAVIDESTKKVLVDSPYIQRSLYYMHTVRWFTYFSLDQFLFLDTNELRRWPIQVLRKIERFLNINQFDWDKVLYFDKSRGFYCYIVNNKETCLGSDKGIQHVSMKASTGKLLKKYFKVQNKYFFEIISKSFYWKYKM